MGGTPQRSGADRLASEPPNTIEEGPLASGLAVGPTGPTGFATAYATSYSCAFEFQPCDLAGFSGVSCATGSSCTAVGTAVANTTLAESWAGTKWTIEPTTAPDKSTLSNLASVSCTAATACLAVGSYYSSLGSGWLPLAELWNGSSWTIRPPPTPSEGSNDVLSYVQCATAKACMAVGSYYSSATSQTVPLVEFWDGSTWTIQTVSLPSGASGGQLFGVSCPSMTACTAVGIYYTALGGPSEELALAESWNGTNWSLQPTPNPISNASYSLNAVWCLSAKSCNAVGRIFTGSNEETLAESWDGTTWSIRPTPNPSASTYSYLANLSCDPSGVPCKAVGTSGNETLVESWDGTTWSTQTTPQPANSTRSSFSDVSCTAANACTAVGQYLDGKEGPTGAYRTLAERWDGTNWTAQPTADAALAGTGSVTNITSSTAELNGTVYPGGAPTTCYFEYGTTSSYGSTIPCAQSTGPGAASVAVSADLTGLSPNTTYYFTLVATNPGGGMTYTPGPASFTTLATSGGGGGGSGGANSGGGGGGGNSGGGTSQPPPALPNHVPANSIGQLYLDGGGCTGTVISGAPNRSVVLTAAHCVLHNGVLVNSVTFAPGHTGSIDDLSGCRINGGCTCSVPSPCPGHSPFGIWRIASGAADHIIVPDAFSLTRSSAYDYAFIVFPPGPRGYLGDVVSGLPLITTDHRGQEWTVFGYGASTTHGIDSCGPTSAHDNTDDPGPPRLQFGCNNIAGGWSGGPWLNDSNGVQNGVGAITSQGGSSGILNLGQDAYGTYLTIDTLADFAVASGACSLGCGPGSSQTSVVVGGNVQLAPASNPPIRSVQATLSLSASVARSARHRRSRPNTVIGSVSIRIPKGRTVRVAVPLNRRGKLLLEKSGRLLVYVTVRAVQTNGRRMVIRHALLIGIQHRRRV